MVMPDYCGWCWRISSATHGNSRANRSERRLKSVSCPTKERRHFMFGTTAPDSTWRTPGNFLAHSSGFTRLLNSKGPASASPPFNVLSIATAGVYGQKVRWTEGLLFILLCKGNRFDEH